VIVIWRQISNSPAISWREQITFDEMMMISALCKTNTLSWIVIVLAHWNNSLWVDMSLHSDILSLFRAIQCLLFFLRAKQISSKYQFDRTGLEHTIYHTTRGEHANHIPPKWFYEYTRESYCSGPPHVGVIMHAIHVNDPWVWSLMHTRKATLFSWF
jgi:hypothetical protein